VNPISRRFIATTALVNPISRRFIATTALAWLTLTASIWLSTGTLAPYAATTNPPLPLGPCDYLYNGDHDHFQATFRLLNGEPRERWQDSVVLRRILYPVLAYPFMKLLGFELGGLLASVLIHWAAFSALVLFLRSRVGEIGAIAGAWLFATYPGVSYWAGLPYAYATIVPFSVLNFILLIEAQSVQRLGRASLLFAAMGVLALSYDFLPLFGPALLLVLAIRRRYRWLPIALACLLAPSAAWALLLGRFFGVSPLNSNTGVYLDILHGWLHPTDLTAWWRLLTQLPWNALVNYFDSNFLFLPALFLALLVLRRFQPAVRLEVAESALLVTTAALFLFNNAVPPYPGIQVRGTVYPRLYQPVFVVFLFFAARMAQAAQQGSPRLRVATLCALTVAANATVAFGPVLRVPYTGHVYIWFYQHTSPDWLERNLRRYGRRPLGFCRHRPATSNDDAPGSSWSGWAEGDEGKDQGNEHRPPQIAEILRGTQDGVGNCVEERAPHERDHRWLEAPPRAHQERQDHPDASEIHPAPEERRARGGVEIAHGEPIPARRREGHSQIVPVDSVVERVSDLLEAEEARDDRQPVARVDGRVVEHRARPLHRDRLDQSPIIRRGYVRLRTEEERIRNVRRVQLAQAP